MTETKSLQLFGDRGEVNELAMRLLKAMPGSRKLTPEQAGTLAQISIAHGLDPFNGEAWFIPGSGVMVGIKGLRKAARRQLEHEGGKGAKFWTVFERVADPKIYLAQDDDLVFECHLRDSESLEAYAKAVERFKALDFELEAAIKAAGPYPVTLGVGIYIRGEATKMQPNEVARKRAEANAIKQRFDVDFFFSEEEVDFDIQISDPEEEPKSAKKSVEELGYEEENPTKAEEKDGPEPWPKKALTVVTNNTVLSTEAEANKLLCLSGMSSKRANLSTIRRFSKLYQGGLDQEMKATDALKYAKDNWQNNGGEEKK